MKKKLFQFKQQNLSLYSNMKSNIVRYKKFTFSNNELAFRVRTSMYNALLQYNANQNGLFNEQEIIQALIGILDQNQNQIKYVINNVFRYDRDGDRKITYDQFVNFCVETHFGQMAIQRLHRNKVYSRGKQRLMNFNEFQITLNESLKHINSTGSRQQYELLFQEVNLDKDGWIKYEDYFMFLRQYFGSLSFAAEQPIQIQLYSSQVESYKGNIDFPEERFARLIYSQLKVLIMEQNINKSLSLTKQQIGRILQKLFRIPAHQKTQIANLVTGNQNQLNYESFMKMIVSFYFCEYDVHKNSIQQINEDSFVNNVKRAAIFVRVKPSQIILREVFKRADMKRKGYLDQNEYVNTLGSILQNYQFDTRGMGQLY